jgi:hypothetical protein
MSAAESSSLVALPSSHFLRGAHIPGLITPFMLRNTLLNFGGVAPKPIGAATQVTRSAVLDAPQDASFFLRTNDARETEFDMLKEAYGLKSKQDRYTGKPPEDYRNRAFYNYEEEPPLLYHPAAPRVVAVGDIHGDCGAFRNLLEITELAKDGQWIGGKAVLVVLGDVLDRGHEEKEVLAELRSLKEQARKIGGAVITLLGNHEVLNFAGDMSYVAKEAMDTFGPDRQVAFAPGGELASELADWPVAAIVGDTAFVHGGLPRDATAGTLDQLNADTRSWILGHAEAPPRGLVPGKSSPVWLREQSVPPNCEPSADCCAALGRTLSRIGATRLVVGHSPQACVNSACDARVWRCDTGMAQAMGSGAIEALEIVGNEVRVINANSPASVSREERQLVTQR